MTSDIKPVAKTDFPSSVSETVAIASTDEDLLHKFVRYGKFRGIVTDVFYQIGLAQKRIRIKNLAKLSSDDKPQPVRDAPSPDLQVVLASANDMRSLFPTKQFPDNGYVGLVRGIDYPLPLDLERLCYRNTAVLAGTGHGKSTLASLLACELHASGKRVVVIDPTGEWKRITSQLASTLHLTIPITCNVVPASVADEDTPPLFQTFQRLKQKDLFEIVDISFGKEKSRFVSVLTKKKRQREYAWDLENGLIEEASSHFAETERTYDFKTCVIVDEAHNFVPATSAHEDQTELTEMFAIVTKEYRKHGLGHIFIDQSLRSISQDLQIQTFFFGSTNSPADLFFLREQLGEDLASAAQRTGDPSTRSWVAFGEGTPVPNIPWELEMPSTSEIPELLRKGQLL